jgi:hypothetical protein
VLRRAEISSDQERRVIIDAHELGALSSVSFILWRENPAKLGISRRTGAAVAFSPMGWSIHSGIIGVRIRQSRRYLLSRSRARLHRAR